MADSSHIDLTLSKHDRVIAEHIRVARSYAERLRGLIGESSLSPGHGLYLPRTNGIHMLFMRFPIDALFVGNSTPGGECEVVAIHEALPPWRGLVPFVRRAHGVVELPAGSIRTAGLRVGDVVRLAPSPG